MAIIQNSKTFCENQRDLREKKTISRRSRRFSQKSVFILFGPISKNNQDFIYKNLLYLIKSEAGFCGIVRSKSFIRSAPFFWIRSP